MDLDYHFSSSKWENLTTKFSQPERWFHFRVSYAASKFASERLKVLARSKEQALAQVICDTYAEPIWYRVTNGDFVPTTGKVMING